MGCGSSLPIGHEKRRKSDESIMSNLDSFIADPGNNIKRQIKQRRNSVSSADTSEYEMLWQQQASDICGRKQKNIFKRQISFTGSIDNSSTYSIESNYCTGYEYLRGVYLENSSRNLQNIEEIKREYPEGDLNKSSRVHGKGMKCEHRVTISTETTKEINNEDGHFLNSCTVKQCKLNPSQHDYDKIEEYRKLWKRQACELPYAVRIKHLNQNNIASRVCSKNTNTTGYPTEIVKLQKGDPRIQNKFNDARGCSVKYCAKLSCEKSDDKFSDDDSTPSKKVGNGIKSSAVENDTDYSDMWVQLIASSQGYTCEKEFIKNIKRKTPGHSNANGNQRYKYKQLWLRLIDKSIRDSSNI